MVVVVVVVMVVGGWWGVVVVGFGGGWNTGGGTWTAIASHACLLWYCCGRVVRWHACAWACKRRFWGPLPDFSVTDTPCVLTSPMHLCRACFE